MQVACRKRPLCSGPERFTTRVARVACSFGALADDRCQQLFREVACDRSFCLRVSGAVAPSALPACNSLVIALAVSPDHMSTQGRMDFNLNLGSEILLHQRHPIGGADGDVVVVEVVARVVNHARACRVAVTIADKQVTSGYLFKHEGKVFTAG